MRTGPELFFATKHYARDSSAKSWWYILSTTILLAAALTGTLWNFHVLAKIACSILAGLLILRLFVIYGMCINPFLNDPRKHFDCLIALLVHIGIGVTITLLFGWQALLLAQTIPHLIADAIGTYLFYAQHNFPDVSFSDKAGWTYEKAALESSSFLKTNRIMAWFTANIGYHHVHHLNARIPFYRLPEVVRELPELQQAKTTSLSPLEIFRCLRLKVWDVESQRMVGMREIQLDPDRDAHDSYHYSNS